MEDSLERGHDVFEAEVMEVFLVQGVTTISRTRSASVHVAMETQLQVLRK